jgi:integrase/recombinase XerD
MNLVEAYLTFLKTEKGSSPATISAYGTDLKLFGQFLVGRDPRFEPTNIAHWEQVSPNTIDRYVFWLQNLKFKQSTISRKVVVVRSFYNFLVSFGFTRLNPAEQRVFSYPTRQIPQILTEKVLETLFEQIKQSSAVEQARDLAMVTLLYSSGIRTSELVGLELTDIQVNSGRICLILRKGKGNERVVNLNNEAEDYLIDYLEQSRPRLLLGSEIELGLFVSCHGNRLTRAGVWFIISKHAQAVGFEKMVTPRILRHTFTARMFASGKGTAEVKELLGHVSLATTRVYQKLG